MHELLPQCAKALESNTACTDLNLSACNIDDAGVAALAKGLSANSGLQTLNLEGNTIKDGGAQELAKAIASNSHLSTLNLLNQKGSRFGDSTLGEFLTMFETNVTLLKIVWRLESRQSFRLTKMLTRNNDIARRIKEGREYADLLPPPDSQSRRLLDDIALVNRQVLDDLLPRAVSEVERLLDARVPLPMTKTLLSRVANVWPSESFRWTMSNEPWCFSRETITPTRPVFLPPEIIARLPVSNLMISVVFPVSRSSFTTSCILISGSGYRIVRPSCVTMYGIPF